MAESGISLFLERIQQNPRDERLLQRFLVLAAEEPDNAQKCAELLSVAQICSIAQPALALQIVLAIFRYARSQDWIDEMRRSAKISMACLKALGRMNAAKAIRLELDRLAHIGKMSSRPMQVTRPPQLKEESSPLPSEPHAATIALKFPPAPIAVEFPDELQPLPLASSFVVEKTDAAFLAVLDPVPAMDRIEPSTPPDELAINFDDVVSAALEESRVHEKARAYADDSTPHGMPYMAEGDTQSRIDFANKNRLMTEKFWAQLYQTLSTTRDRQELVGQFPNKNGLLHFLIDHFRGMGIVLPQKAGQKLVTLLHSDADFTSGAFRDGLTVCLWHGLGSASMQKLLEAAGLHTAAEEYWGYYLDLLLLAQNARRAWYEIRQTIGEKSADSWALVAYSRLPSICKKLRMHDFAWEPNAGVLALVHVLAHRPPPTMGGFFVGK